MTRIMQEITYLEYVSQHLCVLVLASLKGDLRNSPNNQIFRALDKAKNVPKIGPGGK